MKLRTLAVLTLPLCPIVVASAAKAQRNATVVVQFVGESDRFVLPAIIGTSKVEAERTRNFLFDGRFSSGSPVFVVPASSMDHLLDSAVIKGLADGKTHSASSGLRVEIVSEGRHVNQVVPLGQAEPLLAELRQLSANPAYTASLDDIQQRTQENAQSGKASLLHFLR